MAKKCSSCKATLPKWEVHAACQRCRKTDNQPICDGNGVRCAECREATPVALDLFAKGYLKSLKKVDFNVPSVEDTKGSAQEPALQQGLATKVSVASDKGVLRAPPLASSTPIRGQLTSTPIRGPPGIPPPLSSPMCLPCRRWRRSLPRPPRPPPRVKPLPS